MKKSVIESFNSPAVVKTFCGLLFVIVQLCNSLSAQGAIPEKTFPIMGTSDYGFMDMISRYIKETDLDAVYRECDGDPASDFIREGYIYALSVLKFNKQSDNYKFSYGLYGTEIDFTADGSYHIAINIYWLIPSEDGYFFDCNGLTFFSEVKLQGFMNRQFGTRRCKCFLNAGIGFWWFFIVDGGAVRSAYALYGRSENPTTVFDLKAAKIIPYKEFEHLFYKTR